MQCNEERKEEVEKKVEHAPVKKPRILGTADYIAPEVILGHEHTTALDFWSLGVIVYEFLTGALPFTAESPD